jgi:hypothetical protein
LWGEGLFCLGVFAQVFAQSKSWKKKNKKEGDPFETPPFVLYFIVLVSFLFDSGFLTC